MNGELQTDTAIELTPPGGAAPEPVAPAAPRLVPKKQFQPASERRGPQPITDDEAGRAKFEALTPGTKFIDPEGKVREKLWAISSDNALEDFKKVPEGATYLDPEGQERIKPTYEGVGFSAQTWYDMAVSDEDRRRALAYIYGDAKVKKDETGELYVDDDGVKRKPGHGNILKRGAAMGVAGAGPAIGAGVGAVLGGAAGTAAEPGGGTLLGGLGGAAVGSTVMQGFNDLIFSMVVGARRTYGEELGNLALAGGFGAAGELGGAALRATGPAVGAFIEKGVKGGASRFFGEFAGLQEKELRQAYRLRQQGVISRPSNYLKELPSIRKTEAFEEEFLGGRQGIYEPSALEHLEKTSKGILETMGVETKGALREATERPSSEAAGRQALESARFDMAYMNATLDESINKTRAAVTAAKTGEAAEIKTAIEQHTHIATEQRAAARASVDAGISEIRQTVDKALEIAKGDGNSGAVMTAAGNALQALLVASRKVVSKGYEAADAITGGVTRSTEELANSAKNFLDSMPEPFRNKYPEIVGQLQRLAGKPAQPATATAAAVEAEPAKDVTLGQIHNVRSALRHDIDWTDVTPGFRGGAMKHFQNVIDRFIQDEHATSPWKAGVKMLNETDKLYAELIPRHEEETFAALMKGARAKMPLDPQVVGDIVFKPGYTEPRRQLRAALGENLWAAVEAAHTERMIAKHLDARGELNTVGFAEDIVNAANSRARQFPEKTLKLAQDILKVEGKLEIKMEEGDTISTLLNKAKLAEAEAKQLAERDPMGELSEEIKRINKQHKTEAEALRKQGRSEPLGFLYEDSMSHKAVQAADKILGSEDLYLAAAVKWGEGSPEMEALKQVFAHRLLQQFAQDPSKFRQHLQQKVTGKMLKLTFGTDADNVARLVGDMEFLLGYGTEGAGTSMAAASRVLNPTTQVPGGKSGIFKIPIVGNALARVVLGKMYGTFMRYLRDPAGMEWLLKGLEGGPVERENARQAFRQGLKYWGPTGAALSESQYQEGVEHAAPELVQ